VALYTSGFPKWSNSLCITLIDFKTEIHNIVDIRLFMFFGGSIIKELVTTNPLVGFCGPTRRIDNYQFLLSFNGLA
jgi:hypothetical protein